MTREIRFYKDHFLDFYHSQNDKVQQKIEYVLDLVRFEKQIPKKFLKSLANTNSIYEVRVITTFKSIRIMCFFDDGNLIVLLNCFVKQTQKTPRKEIKKAERLKEEYLSNKNNG